MNAENKQNAVEAKEAEKVVILVELTDAQVAALKLLNITEDRDNIAESAFASALRGKMQSAIDKAIKAKYEADTRGKKALSAELELEIQSGIKMKREL